MAARFTRPDPGRDITAHTPASSNLYQYTADNPVNRVDPSGRFVDDLPQGIRSLKAEMLDVVPESPEDAAVVAVVNKFAHPANPFAFVKVGPAVELDGGSGRLTDAGIILTGGVKATYDELPGVNAKLAAAGTGTIRVGTVSAEVSHGPLMSLQSKIDLQTPLGKLNGKGFTPGPSTETSENPPKGWSFEQLMASAVDEEALFQELTRWVEARRTGGDGEPAAVSG